MSKPIITRMNLIDESSDEDNRMSFTYKVEGKFLNVKNVLYAYRENGKQGLPQVGDKDPYADDPGNASICSSIRVKHNGKYDASGSAVGQMTVTVQYLPPDEFSAKRKKKNITDKFQFPWDEPAKVSKTGDAIEVDMWGTDERDKPLQYSNGEPVNLTQSKPLSVINIAFAKKLNDPTDWWSLTDDLLESVNNAQVTLKIGNNTYTYAARTLLVAAADCNVELFRYADPVTGGNKTVLHFDVNLSLVYKKNTWATRIPDEGHVVVDDDNNVREPEVITTKHKQKLVFLNGRGQRLLGDTANAATKLIDTDNVYGGWTTTPYGSVIDKTATDALAGGTSSNARIVILAFMTYEEKDFTPLGLGSLLSQMV